MVQYFFGLVLICAVAIISCSIAHEIPNVGKAISATIRVNSEVNDGDDVDSSDGVDYVDDYVEQLSFLESDEMDWVWSNLEEESGIGQVQRIQFDVLNEGAVGDGVTNDTQAFIVAWDNACKIENASVYVPSGYKYVVYPTTFSGPCLSGLHFQVEGEILAPSEIGAWDGKNVRLWFLFQNLENFTLEGRGSFNGRGQNWWACRDNGTCLAAPNAVTIYQSSHVNVRYITLIDSPQIHINFQYVNMGIARNLKIQAPWSSPNTDGIHIAFTTNFAVQYCEVSTGDDCVSIVTESCNIAVQDIYCGIGCHGISVGSLGANGEHANVSQVLVKNCQLESTTNGLRIKTWQGGTGNARNIEFQNIEMTNVSNPIIIDQYYCPPSQSAPCTNKPDAVAIDLVKFANITGTSATTTAVKLACSEAQPCTNIRLHDINITKLDGSPAGAVCINAFGEAGGAQSPPRCIADQSLSIFKPVTLYLPNFNAILHELQNIFFL